MEISATTVKTLRERTGAGMMECKKALITTAGDIEKAIDLMRTSGIAKAATKANRIAAEGVIAVSHDHRKSWHRASQPWSRSIARPTSCPAAMTSRPSRRPWPPVSSGTGRSISRPSWRCRSIRGGDSVESARGGLIAKIGENITVRRFALMSAPEDGRVGVYRHGTRIGVLVALEGGDVATDLAKDIAMHIAWSRPVCISEADVPQALMDREREIFKAQAAETGKSPPGRRKDRGRKNREVPE